MPFPGISISYRTTGVWGAGLGRNLTAVEFDENNYSLQVAVQWLVDNPPDANNIASIDVDNTNNTMTITMEDTTVFGPFTLPIAEFHDRGEFADATDYVYGDIFTAGVQLVMVLREHTSEAPFNPDATGPGGPLYRVLFDASGMTMTYLDDGYPAEGEPLNTFDVFSVPDVGVFMVLQDHDALATFDPDAVGVDTNPLYKKIFSPIETAVARIQFQYPGTFPQDGSVIMKIIQDDARNLVFPTDFVGSSAHLEVAVTATLEFTLVYAGDEIGTLTFGPGALLDGDGGQFGVFTGTGATIANLELLRVLAPLTGDTTARFLSMSLVGSYVEP